MRTESFEFIIQAGLDELIEQGSKLDPASIEAAYAAVIVCFLRGETHRLAELRQEVESRFTHHPEFRELLIAVRLREQIRARAFDSVCLEEARELSQRRGRWRGELQILLATAYTVYDRYEKARDFYRLAAFSFKEQGCAKKAMRSEMNVLVCEGHLAPDRNLFPRYYDLYRKAIRKETRELTVATTCLLNISREYQRLGAHLAALKYCSRALELFEFQMGELNYFLTLAHRAHLYFEMGRVAEAQLDIECAEVGGFPEVAAALGVLKARLSAKVVGDHPALLPTWRERLLESSEMKLSNLEGKLIDFISIKPRDRRDILDHLYGTRLDYETRANRLKSLLGGLRKKLPSVILCEEGQYRVADEILISGRPSYRRRSDENAS